MKKLLGDKSVSWYLYAIYLSNQLYCDKDLIDLHYKLSEFLFHISFSH